jgi:hypothetical protein
LFSAVVGHITPYALWRVFEQLQILKQPSLHHDCRQTIRNSMGLPCYHLIQEQQKRNEILYLYDFHPRWFFVPPPIDMIHAAPRLILDLIVVRTKGHPAGSQNKQPESSTRQTPSQFEQVVSSRGRKGKNSSSRKRTRTGRSQYVSDSTSSSSGGDLEEDKLMEQELQRLRASGGNSDPMWTEVLEFAGMTRATRAMTKASRVASASQKKR